MILLALRVRLLGEILTGPLQAIESILRKSRHNSYIFHFIHFDN